MFTVFVGHFGPGTPFAVTKRGGQIQMETKTDPDIKHDVVSELAWDTRTWDQKVGVSVDNGIVTLTGIVSSYVQKQVAQAAAHKVTGVLDVANELIVKGKRIRSDTQIAVAVRNSLEWNAVVPDSQITSTVTDGWIKLEGRVNSHVQRVDAEWAVANLTGVIGVTNELNVETPSITTDTVELRASI